MKCITAEICPSKDEPKHASQLRCFSRDALGLGGLGGGWKIDWEGIERLKVRVESKWNGRGWEAKNVMVGGHVKAGFGGWIEWEGKKCYGWGGTGEGNVWSWEGKMLWLGVGKR